jgi:hypothetical protein
MSAIETPQLVVQFGGWFQCRLPTDPDPTWEPRGVSGYTRAIGRETDFDRVLCLQKSDIPHVDRNYRRAELGNPANEVGVTVKAARVEGVPGWIDVLRGAEVRLLRNPEYILWNQIVADGVERIVPLVVPFEIEIRKQVEGGAMVLRRYDPLVPGETGDRFWEVGEPRVYVQRLPTDYVHLSSEVMEAAGISDFEGYFQMRKEWLELQITRTSDPVEREALAVRLQAIDLFSQSPLPASPGLIVNRLGLQCVWEHPVRGEARVEGCDLLGGEVLAGGLDDPGLYWHTRFWHGAWDGDLLRGYMQGELRMPFRVEGAPRP